MRWHRISPLHSEDVIPTARAFVRNGATDPEFIHSRLTQRGWDAASIFGVVREVELATGKALGSRQGQPLLPDCARSYVI